jgi:peptidoglycan L-alanyl-D-glutamate endopeptidase CwlK
VSRKLEDLQPHVEEAAKRWLAACDAAGLEVLVTHTLRTNAEQDELYAQGRTKPGRKVTNAKGGQSFHNYGLALDFVPKRGGDLVWGTSGKDMLLWMECIELAEKEGFESGARWTGFRDIPHLQITGGKTIAELKA